MCGRGRRCYPRIPRVAGVRHDRWGWGGLSRVEESETWLRISAMYEG